jgi:quercetin dioxygenase-like cupin family protein
MARNNKGFTVKAGEDRFGEHTKMAGVTSNVLDVKVSSKDTNGELTVFEQTGFTPKGGPPLHIHLFQDEMFYVIEGDYLFQVGEETYKLKSGDTIFLPREVPHAFAQLTEKGRMVLSFQPSGKMEEFFKKTSLWTRPPTKEEIVQVFEEHDMKVAGPPLKVD